MILAKIDVSKIDKSKLFTGKKGVYLDLVLIESKSDKFGNDYMVYQGISKEERERGVKGETLGNAKIYRANKLSEDKSAPTHLPVDDIPF